jgi:hypothetical protein
MTDLFFGPLNFRPTAVERMGRTGNHDQDSASKAACGMCRQAAANTAFLIDCGNAIARKNPFGYR